MDQQWIIISFSFYKPNDPVVVGLRGNFSVKHKTDQAVEGNAISRHHGFSRIGRYLIEGQTSGYDVHVPRRFLMRENHDKN